MENKTLTSALAITLVLAGSATFAMKEDKNIQDSSQRGCQIKFSSRTSRSDLNLLKQTGTIMEEKKIKTVPIYWHNNPTINHIAHSQFIYTSPDTMDVMTNNAQAWKHQAESQSFPLKDNTIYRLSFALTMEKDADVNLGILSGDRTRFLQSNLLAQGNYDSNTKEYKGQFDLVDFKGEKDKFYLVIYNQGKSQNTTFTILPSFKMEKEKTSFFLFLNEMKEPTNHYVITSLFKKDSDTQNKTNTPKKILNETSSTTSTSVQNNNNNNIDVNSNKKGGLFSSFGNMFSGWFSSSKTQTVTQEDINNFPSNCAFLRAALEMEKTSPKLFGILNDYVSDKKAAEDKDFKDVASMLRDLAIKFKGVQKDELTKATEGRDVEFVNKLSRYLTNLRKKTLEKFQEAMDKKLNTPTKDLGHTKSVYFSIEDVLIPKIDENTTQTPKEENKENNNNNK